MKTKQRYINIDPEYISLDKQKIKRANNLLLIPKYNNRTGGKSSYGEWCHVIGIFQTLFGMYLGNRSDNHIVDFGCGSGLVGISSEPFVKDGKYMGIDICASDIVFCKSNFPKDNFNFVLSKKKQRIGVEDSSINMFAALSVWTHLDYNDAIYYFKEVDRILKRGAKAIITFFILNDKYSNSLNERYDDKGKYHNTSQLRWIFNTAPYESKEWLCPSWTKRPYDAVGVTENGLKDLISHTNLKLINIHNGNWKEIPGIFFQDILVFEKQ